MTPAPTRRDRYRGRAHPPSARTGSVGAVAADPQLTRAFAATPARPPARMSTGAIWVRRRTANAATASAAVNGSTIAALPSSAVTPAIRPRPAAVAPRRKPPAHGDDVARRRNGRAAATNTNDGRKIATVA